MGRPMNQEHESEANVDTIVHLGAGNCSDLATWQAANPRRIVLVEPNPHHTHHLTAHARGDERIHVFQQAVGDPDASPRFRRFNIPALSSLREPTGLLELFPGLHTEREFDVEVIEPRAFIQSLELAPDRKHWLIIDTPGEEEYVVTALRAGDQLEQFDQIVLYCGVDALYQGSESAAEILGQLNGAGYDIAQRDASDPDFAYWVLKRNTLRLENQALRQQVTELERQADDLNAARDACAQEAESMRRERDALASGEKNVDTLRQQLADRDERLQLANDEVAKAEGQIALISDLLLGKHGHSYGGES